MAPSYPASFLLTSRTKNGNLGRIKARTSNWEAPLRKLSLLWVGLFLALMPLTSRAADAPTGLLCDLLEHPEETVINTATPEFGWIYNPSVRNDVQTGYRIIVASSEALANQNKGDVWDSGVISNSASINVRYAGKTLHGDADYFWRVQTMDAQGQMSPFSAIQYFRTDAQLAPSSTVAWNNDDGLPFRGLIYNASSNIWANRYPLHFEAFAPVLVTNTAPGRWFIDFGQDAFGYVTVRVNGSYDGTNVQARFGEMADGFAVKTCLPARCLVRYTNVVFTLQNGDITYQVRPPVYPV